MKNQIQLYHDLTAFWLDKNWETPREKQLEKRVAQLSQENNSLKMQNKALQEDLEPLMVFKDIPCKYCGNPLSNQWTRSQVLKAFDVWGHTACINRYRR